MKSAEAALSVAIITKNEEARLPACLESVSFADDIVVVDSGSTDRTVEIAKGFGCRVYVEEWKGYGPQKQSAVDKCKHEWVLIIDADERIPLETKRAIKEVLASPLADAYSFPRRNYLHSRWIRHSGWWPDRVVRLVRKNKGRFHGLTHEKWVTTGRVNDTLNTPIEHFSFSTYSHMLRTLDNYSTAISRELFEKGKRTNMFAPIYHGIGMFLKVYLLKRGFFDGLDGLVIALTSAGGSFFKYAKLLELQRMKNKK
jgi:glycosyltransferase involved in cell wall biosynthesis